MWKFPILSGENCVEETLAKGKSRLNQGNT